MYTFVAFEMPSQILPSAIGKVVKSYLIVGVAVVDTTALIQLLSGQETGWHDGRLILGKAALGRTGCVHIILLRHVHLTSCRSR